MTVPYCTPLAVKFLSQIKYTQFEMASDSDYDGFIQDRLIPSAMKIIDGYAGHNFQNNLSSTITVDGSGKRIQLLPPPYIPAISVSAVTIGGVNVTSSIKVFPTYLAYENGFFYKSPSLYKNVSITLQHGYTQVPDDVEYCCAQLVANMLKEALKSKLTPASISKGMQSGAESVIVTGYKNAFVFTEEIKGILDQYRYSYLEVST